MEESVGTQHGALLFFQDIQEEERLSILSYKMRARAFEKGLADIDKEVCDFIRQGKRFLHSNNSSTVFDLRLTLAAIFRHQGQFHRSWFHCLKVYSMTATGDLRQAEALFGVALSLSAMDRNYEALVRYEKLYSHKLVSDERVILAKLNEAYIRLQISDIQGALDILPILPRDRRYRLQVLLDFLLHGELKTEHYNLLRSDELPFSEKARLWIYLLESALLHEDSSSEKIEEVAEFLKLVDSPLSRAVLQLLKAETISQKFSDPQDEIDFMYLRILFLAKKQKPIENEYQALDLLLKSHKIHDPMIPRTETLKHPKYPLHSLIAKAVFAKQNARPQILFCERTMSLSWGEEQWSLKKNPKTWMLIKTLANANETLDKKEIHFALTGNRYIDKLHDPRLWMLLKRFRSQMIRKWSIDPLHLPGDNQIYLNVDFLRISS